MIKGEARCCLCHTVRETCSVRDIPAPGGGTQKKVVCMSCSVDLEIKQEELETERALVADMLSVDYKDTDEYE